MGLGVTMLHEPEANGLGLNYLLSELIAGRMFADIAASAGNDIGRRERNRAAAEDAYATYCRCCLRVQLSRQDAKELEVHAGRLRVALESIPKD
jgi:hypothetical protein